MYNGKDTGIFHNGHWEPIWFGSIITVMPHKHHGISMHQSLNGVLNNVFRLISKQLQSSYWLFVKGCTFESSRASRPFFLFFFLFFLFFYFFFFFFFGGGGGGGGGCSYTETHYKGTYFQGFIVSSLDFHGPWTPSSRAPKSPSILELLSPYMCMGGITIIILHRLSANCQCQGISKIVSHIDRYNSWEFSYISYTL